MSTKSVYDCLERIFDFLDLESLLNVAGTCKRLQIAAAAKLFGDDFGEKTVHLLSYKGLDEITLGSSQIYVFGPKYCLSFLRCFGAKIRHLLVYNGSLNAPYSHFIECINEYINKYCADTLISVEFYHNFPKCWISNFSKPFKSVEKAVVSVKRDELSKFVNWFPKLRHLELFSLNTDRFAEPLSFPNLEYLKVLKTNTSLMKLELDSAFGYKPVDEEDIAQFAEQHPLLAELCLHKIEVDQAIMFSRHLTSLKRFKFELTDHSEYNRLLDQLDSKWQPNLDQFQNVELSC